MEARGQQESETTATERAEGVATSKGSRSGRRKEGRRRGVRRGPEVRGGLSLHDMNEPCSVTKA